MLWLYDVPRGHLRERHTSDIADAPLPSVR